MDLFCLGCNFPLCWVVVLFVESFGRVPQQLQQMKQHYQVTYDSGGIAPSCFIVHKSDTTKHYFRESKEGLFYLDSQVDLNSVAFVTMVEDMESLYSTCDICNAKATRKLQCIISWKKS